MVPFLKEIKSLGRGIASFFLKEAVIRPLPKNLSSDPIYLYNYKPVLNAVSDTAG